MTQKHFLKNTSYFLYFKDHEGDVFYNSADLETIIWT